MNQRHQRGFSYVETMVAIVLLAIIAVPAADAIRTGLDAGRIAAGKTQELRCMKNQMETVLAQPYQHLWNAARGTAVPSDYSLAADASCVARNVFITKYQHRYGGAPVFIGYPEQSGKDDEREAVMLYITVSSPQTAYTFTTMVAR